VSGAVLLVAMFLDWYSAPGGATANAWEAFTVNDVLVAIAALFGIALFAGAATQRSPAVAQSVAALTLPFAFVGSVLVILRTLSLPGAADGRQAGLYIGLVAVVGVLVGAWRSMGDESFPREVTPQVEVTPLPAPKPRSEPAGDE
jgi:hypothetical protein